MYCHTGINKSSYMMMSEKINSFDLVHLICFSTPSIHWPMPLYLLCCSQVPFTHTLTHSLTNARFPRWGQMGFKFIELHPPSFLLISFRFLEFPLSQLLYLHHHLHIQISTHLCIDIWFIECEP